MIPRALLLALAALLLTGCATTIQGGDTRERWLADFQECTRENYAFSFIPDYGITFEIQRNKCMRDRHWVRGSQFPGARPGGFPEAAPQPSPPPPPPPPPAAATTEAPDWCRGPGQEWLGTACLTRGR